MLTSGLFGLGCIHVCVCVCVCRHMRVCKDILHMFMCLWGHAHVLGFVLVCLCVRESAYACDCLLVYVCACVCVSVHMCVCTHVCVRER